ncbi:MAG: hypothetical protein JJ892_09590 [Balneola sp.]|nr:hypothetical protein [Balneola sp.]MBO6649761.1 hypothetical protein [Balneola sp.]MBO6712324.1 hypothetical protein [Balneola sp.]MBO6800518.1 hypothetical protein [Balneola sp.]MBO6871472.1 hypothetical protein [Balneola sp.]
MNFEQQIAYNSWANQLIAEAIGESTETRTDTNLLRQFGHLLHVEIEWYNRVMKVNEDTEIWPTISYEECIDLMSKGSAVDFLEFLPILDEVCSYKNSKGVEYKTKVSEILQHVIIHGQHHRAQIALLLRQKGITPPGTDFIYFTRQS